MSENKTIFSHFAGTIKHILCNFEAFAMMPIWTLERRAWSTTTNYAVVYAFEEVVGQFGDFNGILYYCMYCFA